VRLAYFVGAKEVAVRSLAVIAVGLALGIGAAVTVIHWSDWSDPDDGAGAVSRRPAPQAPPEPRTARDGNRRVLTGEQTRGLVRYATALYACLGDRGIDVSAPKKNPRAITIAAATPVGLERLVALSTSCAAPLGDPPKPSSLQAVDARTIVLSVPKQCLLDPKTELAAPRP
jgi:hypothetical protein